MASDPADRGTSPGAVASPAAPGASPHGGPAADGLRARFAARFGRAPLVVARAPGRVNLIGEHTDYNDGFVLPVAIDRFTLVAAAPRPDRRVTVHSETLGETATFDLDAPAAPTAAPGAAAAANAVTTAGAVAAGRAHGFVDYLRGTARELEAAGTRLPGADLLVAGDLPVGAGLSSSAALDVAAAAALLAMASDPRAAALDRRPLPLLDRRALALLGQRVENRHVGTRCGIMDPLVVAAGQADHALLIDCRSLAIEAIPLPPGLRIVVCDSLVHHSLASGEYNRRREECEEAVRILAARRPAILALRDATTADLEAAAGDLPPVLRRRARHVLAEDRRVLEAAAALRAGRIDLLGPLFAASHESLRADYEVSCRELDLLVEAARATPGVIATRMTGGGFGGATVNLVREEAVAPVVAAIVARYAAAAGRRAEVHVCRAADGVGVEG